jgi:hypothetical protein
MHNGNHRPRESISLIQPARRPEARDVQNRHRDYRRDDPRPEGAFAMHVGSLSNVM